MKIRILDRYEPKNKTLSFMIGVKVKKRILSFQNNLLTQYSNASFFLLKDFSVYLRAAPYQTSFPIIKRVIREKIYSGVRRKESRYQRGRMNLGYESRKRSFFLVLLSSAQQ